LKNHERMCQETFSAVGDLSAHEEGHCSQGPNPAFSADDTRVKTEGQTFLQEIKEEPQY